MSDAPQSRDPSVPISVFFYGSFMDEQVRREHGWAPRPETVAALHGFEFHRDPLARLVRRDGASSYGVLCAATRAELDALYAARWMDQYHAEPVTVELPDGRTVPAVVYLPPGPVVGAEAPAGYARLLAGAARRLRFPEWYCRRLEGDPAAGE